MSGPLIMAYDIECAPALVWTYDLWPKAIGIDQIVEHPRMVSFAAQFEQDGKRKAMVYRSEFHHGRTEMLDTLHEMFDKADIVMGWNNKSFDDPYVMGEFALEEMGRPSPFQSIDLMRVEKKHFRLMSRKLDYAARRFVDDQKDGVNALRIWLEIKELERQIHEVGFGEGFDADLLGDLHRRLKRLWDKFARYNKQDVALLWKVRDEFLPWVDELNFNNFQEDGVAQIVCAKCGSTNLHRRGLYRTGVSTFQVYRCEHGHQTRALKRQSGAVGR
jgi:hypothetical protein